MCDFRKINKIKFLDSGEELDVSNTTIDILGADMDKVIKPGFYSVGASGSFHAYFTGKEWLREDVPDWKEGAYKVIAFTEDCSCGGLFKTEKEMGD